MGSPGLPGSTIAPPVNPKLPTQKPNENKQQAQNYGYAAFSAEKSERPYKCFEMFLLCVSYFLIIVCPFALCCCWVVIKEYERAITFRFGRLVKMKPRGPGLIFILPCVDTYAIVDLRTLYFDVPPQEILTKDSVTVAVDAVVYYRTFDATMAIINVQDYKRASHLLAASILRNTLGTRTMSDILTQRDSLSNAMQIQLDEATDPWGVKIERVEIKDVRLPMNMQRAMAAEAEASREARAQLIAAEGEQKASRALKEAATVIMESPAAMQLRYLQTLNTISAEKNSTIVFPVPLELMSLLKK